MTPVEENAAFSSIQWDLLCYVAPRMSLSVSLTQSQWIETHQLSEERSKYPPWSWSSVSWLWGWRLRFRDVGKRLICRLGCRLSCGLRPCFSNILLGPTCRINFLCIYHNNTSYKHMTAITIAYKHMKQETKWLGLNSKYTYNFILLKPMSPLPCSLTSNDSFATSWIVPFSMTLPTFDSLVHSRYPIWIPWLVRGFFP